MASPKNSAEGKSRVFKPIANSWKSMFIGWGMEGTDKDIEGGPIVLPLPFIKFNTEKKFTASHAMTDYNAEFKENPHEQQFEFERKESKFSRVLKEWNFGAFEKKDLVDLAEMYDEYNEEVSDSHKDPVGIVVAEISQWVCIKIEKMTPSDPPAQIHLWGFLQPRGFNGEEMMSLQDYNPFSGSATQKDEADHLGTSVSDDRRSGWCEYFIHCGTKTVHRIIHKPDGSRDKEVVPDTDFKFYTQWLERTVNEKGKTRLVSTKLVGHIVKLKIKITNELTKGDISANKEMQDLRKKQFEKLGTGQPIRDEDIPKNPEQMVEIGCWLKVWVRNALCAWKVFPADDRSNKVVHSMDNTDIGERIYGNTSKKISVDTPFPWRNHGFLRGRIVSGESISATEIPKPSDLVPLYVALVTEEGKKHIDDLITYLEAPPENNKSAFKQIASGAVGFLGNSFISLILYFGMKEYLKREQITVPDSTTTTHIFEEERKKRIQGRIKFIQSVLRFFDVPNKFASFGVSGFRATSLEALRNEAKNRPGLFNLYSTVFSTQLDMALCLHPSLMNDLVADSLQARSEALRRYLGQSPSQGNAAHQNGLIENLQEKLTAFPNPELKTLSIDLSFPLASYSKTEYFPKPFGMLLTIPFVPPIPVGFGSIKFSRQASLDLNLQIYWNPNAFGMGFGFSIGEKSGLRIGVEVCALWAVLARPEYIPAGSQSHSTHNPGPGHSPQAAAAQEISRIDNRAQSGQAATSAEIQESVLLRLVQNLQGAMNASVTIDLGLTAGGHIGWRFNYDRKKKEIDFQFKALEDKDLKFELKGDLTFEIKLGFLTWAFKIGEIDLARLTPEQFQVPLTGVFCGDQVDYGPAFTYKMIEEVGDNLYLFVGTEDDDHYGVTGVFGRAASSALKLKNDHEFIHFGESRKLYLNFASKEPTLPKIDFNVYRSEGVNKIPKKEPGNTGWPFLSTSKAPFAVGKDVNGKPVRRLEYNISISLQSLGNEYLGASLELKKNQEQTCYQSVRLARSLIHNEYVPVQPEAVLFSKGRKLARDILLLRSPKLVLAEGGLGLNELLGRCLTIRVKIQNFDDGGLWVRLRLRSNGTKGGAINFNNQEWNFISFENPIVNSHVVEGRMKIQISKCGLSAGQPFYFELALFPDDECVLSGGDSSIAIFNA